MQEYFVVAGAFQELDCIQALVMGGGRITENPVGLNEDMSHLMSQSCAIWDPLREQYRPQRKVEPTILWLRARKVATTED
jgi:hypothetical protein